MPKKNIVDEINEAAKNRWQATKTDEELVREALDAFYKWHFQDRQTLKLTKHKTLRGEEVYTCLDTIMLPCQCRAPGCQGQTFTIVTATLQKCGNGFVVLPSLDDVQGGAQ